MISELNYLICIPVLNGGVVFRKCMAALIESVAPENILVIDSGSSDGSIKTAESLGVNLYSIEKHEFNHGGTRNLALQLFPEAEYIIYLTQDAILEDSQAIQKILSLFEDKRIGAVCGRQLPHDDANVLAKHARIYNYPAEVIIKSLEDKNRYGIKTAFLSNSFAAYRVEALKSVGKFPQDTIMCEDMYVAAKMLISDYKIGYSGQSSVKHSHNYTFSEELKRYFDIGVFHKNNPWIINTFGKAEGEGLRYMLSELRFVAGNKPSMLIKCLLNNFAKIIGIKLGAHYQGIPKKLRKQLSMHSRYWDKG